MQRGPLNEQQNTMFFSLVFKRFVVRSSREVGAHPALGLDNTHFPLLNEEVGNQVVRRQKGHAALTNRARTAFSTWHFSQWDKRGLVNGADEKSNSTLLHLLSQESCGQLGLNTAVTCKLSALSCICVWCCCLYFDWPLQVCDNTSKNTELVWHKGTRRIHIIIIFYDMTWSLCPYLILFCIDCRSPVNHQKITTQIMPAKIRLQFVGRNSSELFVERGKNAHAKDKITIIFGR